MPETEEKWWDVLYDDPPFNVHIVTNPEYASHMSGEKAQIYLQQFKQKYESSLADCVVTTVAGDPGTGKSYFFSHLVYRMLINRDMPGIPIIIRLLGKKYSTKEIYSQIRENRAYREACERAGIEIRDVPDEVFGHTIGEEITAIRQIEPYTSVCLLLDNVDEYVRSNGIRYAREEHMETEEARKKAMLSLLRLVNAITDSVGTGLCVVLSLTVDMVKLLNLEGSENIFTSLVGTDASLRRRFQPIYESSDSEKLHYFGSIELEDTYEMIANYMDSFFEKYHEIEQMDIEKCKSHGFNIYPFEKDAIELIHKASGYPGEIVLGCLSAVQRFRDFQNYIQVNHPEDRENNPTITRTYAALGILQMSEYFQNVGNTERGNAEFIKRLKEIIGADIFVLYLEVFPQLVERTKLADVDLKSNFGEAFSDFLGRMGLGDEYQPLQSKQRFMSTRGKIEFPDFPIIDCTFKYKGQKFGVQFISENCSGLDVSKYKTAATTIKTTGADHFEEEDFLDKVIFICLTKDAERSIIADRISSAIDRRSLDESTWIDVQGKDYRPRVGVTFVDEETVWNWKTLSQTDMLTNEQKNMIALTMEQTEYITWVEKINVRKTNKKGTWGSLLEDLLLGTDIFPSVHPTIRGIPPDGGGWER
ncbi:MAG: hypothetical protein U9O85_03880 [Euryarchaeota archaeon]|nr:hypothetical protein [Euryarchaeota archaeon]